MQKQNKNIHFDIILPSIGRPSLFQAIDSVLHQDFQDWKLWVVCDGLGHLDHIIEDSRVTIIGSDLMRHEDYGAWARNNGIAMGNNPWIAYIDDDDIWYPNHLSSFLSLLADSPRATMIRTAGQAFSLRHKSPRHKALKRKLGIINSTDILTVGMAHTRELFYRTAGWMPCDNHDKLLWNKMLQMGGVPVESEAVTFEFAR